MINKPIELQNAKVAQMQAWADYFATVEATKDAEAINQAYLVCIIMDKRVSDLYNAWQKIGGTSNIQSIALHNVNVYDHVQADVIDIIRWQDETETTRRSDYPI